MLIFEPCTRIRSPQPRTFMGLMELYEQNYIRFRQLCPGLNDIETYSVSVVQGALDLHLRVLETTTYTRTVLLTYYLQGEDYGFCANPNVRVRIYHDARQAEVLSRVRHHLGKPAISYDLSLNSELSSKWTVNRFLYKWLGYCHYQGHRFDPLQG